jgi:hypothetical protein
MPDSAKRRRHARRIILAAEYGLHFAKEVDHLHCVEHPDLVMLRRQCCRAGEREYRSLADMQDELRRIEHRTRPRAVVQEVARERGQ